MSTNCASAVLTIAAVTTLFIPESLARQPHIAPIQSHPHGQTYSEWAVDWWQVALETPASVNPILDETGENCDQGNQGNVWFLFGTFGGPVERTCQIPVGTALFFPLINRANLGEEGVDDLEEQRNNVNGVIDAAGTLFFEFSGEEVNDLDQYFEQDGQVFEVRFPDNDAIFGLDGVVFNQSVEAGFYLFVRPLPPGSYTLNFGGTDAGNEQDVTYHLTITRGPRV